MDIIKSATDWAKAELFSTPFFVLFGIAFILASIGFWQLGKSDLAKAYIFPTLIAGTLLVIIGLGLFFTNKARLNSFETAYKENPSAFVKSETARAEATIKEYKNVVFTAVPLIIIACAIILMLVDKSIWRASAITTIAMLTVILLIDGTASARMKSYHNDLKSTEIRH